MRARFFANGLFAIALFASAPSCQTYEPPPDVVLVGADGGVLTDTSAPIVLGFTEPVRASSLRARIVRFTTDDTGHLVDEDAQPGSPDLLFSYEPDGTTTGGKAVLAADRTSLSITMDPAPVVGQRFVLVVDPGLEDDAGRATGSKRRIVFGFDFRCGVDPQPTKLPSGDYFFLVAVEHPLGIQLRLFSHLDVDPMTGKVTGRFTDAVRNRDGSRCPGGCPPSDACQTIPQTMCVAPSTNAGSTDEYPDYLPNADPPYGFNFAVSGCVRDQPDGSTAFAIAPVDVKVQQPNVTVVGVTLSASFSTDAAGVLRAEGSLRAKDMLLGDISSGAGDGTLRARVVPEGTAPGEIPVP